MVLSDEIYSELVYSEEPYTSIASIDGMRERTVVINGFSKTFAMTGWRLGYAMGPAPIIKMMILPTITTQTLIISRTIRKIRTSPIRKIPIAVKIIRVRTAPRVRRKTPMFRLFRLCRDLN